MKFLMIIISATLLVSCASKDKEAAETAAPAKMEEAAKDAAKQTTAAAGEVSCTNQKDVRSLMVKKMESGGCELIYKKFGAEKTVASSGASTKYCEEVSKKIQNNLSKSGFSCQ